MVLLVVAATPATQAAAYKEGDNIGENKCPKEATGAEINAKTDGQSYL